MLSGGILFSACGQRKTINHTDEVVENTTLKKEDTLTIKESKLVQTNVLPTSPVAILQQKYVIKAEKGAVITHNNGTTIHIPADALTDQTGAKVTGEVNVSYRELYDAVDVVASNIPMLLDSFKGNPRYLETVGMMEIHASQGNKKLNLRPDAHIEVRMAFTSMHSDYNVYQYNNAAHQWKLAGKEEGYVEKMGKFSSDQNTITEENNQKNKKEPYGFQLDVDFAQFPELKKFKSVSWVYAGKKNTQDVEKNKWVLDKVWQDVLLESKSNNTYQMTFVGVNGKDNFVTLVRPIESKSKPQVKKLEEKSPKMVHNYHWVIHRFGLWNCGRIYDNDKSISILCNFVFNKPCKPKTSVYYIDCDNRAVIDYNKPQQRQTRLINYEEKGKFVALTENHELFVSDLQEVKWSTMKTLHSYTFSMKLVSDSVFTIPDIRKRLLVVMK